jgi:hypothetical protein
MILAQFGSKTAQGHKPAWLAAMADLRSAETPTAKSNWIEVAHGHYDIDGYGAGRAPLARSELTAEGMVYHTVRDTLDEQEHQLKKFVGVKDWLIGYRYVGCKCGTCGPYMRFCQSCGTLNNVQWYAKRCRFQEFSVEERNDLAIRQRSGGLQLSVLFEDDTPWQKMDVDRWAWGLPEALYQPLDQYDVNYDECHPPKEVNEMRWPCRLPACTAEPPFRFYRRYISNWRELYCINYWSAGKWIRGSVGGSAVLIVDGDVSPASRLAFTNFTDLTVTICSPTGEECSFTIEGPVSEPQYALVSSETAGEVRYCPINDDECLDMVPAVYDDVASSGQRIAITSHTCPLPATLWPGRNKISFSGFRLPGSPFHWSYDIIPQYV